MRGEISDKQKLVNICFLIALTMKGNKKLNGMSNEELSEWVAGQLRGCGFDTEPVGCSWGILKEREDV